VEFFPGAPDGAELEAAMQAALKAYRATHDGNPLLGSDPAAAGTVFHRSRQGGEFPSHQMTLQSDRWGFSEPNAVGHAMRISTTRPITASMRPPRRTWRRISKTLPTASATFGPWRRRPKLQD